MTGIICALKIEVDGLKTLMNEYKKNTYAGLDFISGKINNKDVVLLECGIGKVNAAIGTQIMIDRYNPDVIINSGIAGSLSKDLKIGDIVVSKDCVQHDMDGTEMGDPRGEIWYTDEKRIDIPADKATYEKLFDCCKVLKNVNTKLGRVATGDTFVASIERRKFIADEFNALCCEMEGGAVGQVCYRNKVPFAVLRSISDDFNNNEFVDFEKFRVLAAENSIKVMTEFLA
ncbi:MAG: 5'-methylthioadenosine/adenosylhomocysteine nucleosidase [Oscillospiraceae bacterium]|nr:5'-methylthioadenosine/adenosylhomocysteine nucleosidase [Oscillospiraceae bacterium]